MTDIFISFKNTDKNGTPTPDSGVAAELYDELTKRGYSVFMMNKTLKEMGESYYKRAIDDALEEASCLIVVGSNINYLKSQWVRYEWDTYLAEILAGRKLGNIFLFGVSGADVEDFPIGLRRYQLFKDNSKSKMYEFIENSLGKRDTVFDKNTYLEIDDAWFTDYIDHTEENYEFAKTIAEKIVSFFKSKGVNCLIKEICAGTEITEYRIKPENPKKLNSSLLKYERELSYDLGVYSLTMHIDYAFDCLSIELQNPKISYIGLKEIVSSPSFKSKIKGGLTFALGKTPEGKIVCPDLTALPHLLIAGAPGSGTDQIRDCMLASLIMTYSPEKLKLLLIDTKQVNFDKYKGIPHIITGEPIYDPAIALASIAKLTEEMQRRYDLFRIKYNEGNGVQIFSIEDYNDIHKDDKLPYIVAVIDDISDCAYIMGKKFETELCKLLSKGRIAGIHIVVCTQRPDTKSLPAQIEVRIPARVITKVSTLQQSQLLLDSSKAEKLTGKGDLLFVTPQSSDTEHMHVCLITPAEIEGITSALKKKYKDLPDKALYKVTGQTDDERHVDDTCSDEINTISEKYIEALKLCIEQNQASISLLMRKLSIGFNHASKIIEWLEVMNFVSSDSGNKPRKVLLTMEQFKNIFGDK